MKWINQYSAAAVALVVLSMFYSPLSVLAAEDDERARGQFEEILQGINEKSFAPAKAAFDKNDLSSRIYGIRVVDPDVRRAFNENFWEMVESVFLGTMPNSNSDAKGEIINFEFQNGKGQAVVRYKLPRHSYAYQIWQLQHDSRQKLRILDWYDSNTGQDFTAEVGEALVVVMPSRAATRRILSNKNPTDRQLFQVTEIYKAARDRQPPRFFEIYDDLDPEMQEEPLTAKFAVEMANTLKDGDRFLGTLNTFSKIYGSDSNYALTISDAYLMIERYEDAYNFLQQYHKSLKVVEGAIPARLSALALALGHVADAEKYALEATTAEPSLKLGWWSLLRARSSAEDFEGATEVLTRLADDFGERFDVGKLRRDRFRGFLGLANSQEFKDWQEARP